MKNIEYMYICCFIYEHSIIRLGETCVLNMWPFLISNALKIFNFSGTKGSKDLKYNSILHYFQTYYFEWICLPVKLWSSLVLSSSWISPADVLTCEWNWSCIRTWLTGESYKHTDHSQIQGTQFPLFQLLVFQKNKL